MGVQKDLFLIGKSQAGVYSSLVVGLGKFPFCLGIVLLVKRPTIASGISRDISLEVCTSCVALLAFVEAVAFLKWHFFLMGTAF